MKRSGDLGRAALVQAAPKANKQTVGRTPAAPDYVPRVPDQPMTPKELAAFLKVSPITVRRMLRKKQLPFIRVGQRVRFLPGQVLRALQERTK